MSKKCDLRVWNFINMPSDPYYFPVNDIDHARRLIEALADSQLLDDSIHSNVFGLEVFENGEWIEWTDEEGRDLDEHFDDGND